MPNDYECHVTIACEPEKVEELRGLIEYVNWSFSQITGDSLLGEEIFCYATNHYDTLNDAIAATQGISQALLMGEYDVRRRKVESIMFDERHQFGAWLSI